MRSRQVSSSNSSFCGPGDGASVALAVWLRERRDLDVALIVVTLFVLLCLELVPVHEDSGRARTM